MGIKTPSLVIYIKIYSILCDLLRFVSPFLDVFLTFRVVFCNQLTSQSARSTIFHLMVKSGFKAEMPSSL